MVTSMHTTIEVTLLSAETRDAGNATCTPPSSELLVCREREGAMQVMCMARDKHQMMAVSLIDVGHAQARAYPQVALMLVSIAEVRLQVC